MRYADAVRGAAARLAVASDTPRLDAELLLAHVAGVSRSVVLAFPERVLTCELTALFEALVGRRCAGEPLAYLVGEKEFYSLTLAVGPSVLVPRPETEHLAEAALARFAEWRRPAVLDLGTGSGALALAIKRERPDAVVVGADSSEAALRVARANGMLLGLDVEWVLSDWFAALGGRRFAAIVCNPPYLESGDPHFETGIAFEPRAALDGGADGLGAIRRVLRDAPAHLEPGGVLLLEHGHAQQRAVCGLAAECGCEVLDAARDLAGRDRYVVVGNGRG
jgi:release factor glutamine methyltransferase